jgi:PilZ domain
MKREVRRRRHQSAWISVDGVPGQYECRLSNLSRAGAQIIIGAGTELPGRFAISFVPNTLGKKNCDVIWRRGKTIGVRFVG